jgi:uncharacterized protein (TIGR00369 family)
MSSLVPKRPAESRTTLALITEPGHANAYGLIHGGVLLRLADECGAVAALRHAGGAMITTAAIDSLTFLHPVRVGERVEVTAEVTHVGRTSIEARITIQAEPLSLAEPRTVAIGYGLYVALDEAGRPREVAPLVCETQADRQRDEAARARQQVRLARREEARGAPE